MHKVHHLQLLLLLKNLVTMELHHKEPNLVQDSILPMGVNNILSTTTDVLNRIGNPQTKHPMQHDLFTFESFTSAIKKWRESTSTSPSGRHLGHYKSLIVIDSNLSNHTEAQRIQGWKS
jgi:hypothetical protein